MSHGLLTLFNRSIRLDARGVKGHAFRIAFALFIYFGLLNAYLTSLAFGAPGLRFFSAICYLNLFFIFLAGCSFFATAVTEEKEEGTLGLLKMAGMSRGAILLGKSTSRLLSSVLLLVIQFPFLLLAITLGGVLYGQVVAAAVALLSFLAFTANAALLFSVICQRSGSAVAFTVLVTLARFFGPPVYRWAAANLSAAGGLPVSTSESLLAFADWFDRTSPFQRLSAIMMTGFAESPFSAQVAFDVIASVVCFSLAWLLFDQFTEDEKAGAPSRGMVFRKIGRLRFFSAGRVWRNPLLWKDFHFTAGGWTMAIVKFIAYGMICATIAGFLWYDSGGNRSITLLMNDAGGVIFYGMLIAGAIELAVMSSRILHDEWQWKTLDALLLLPKPIVWIGWSKLLGGLLGLIPALCYALVGVALSEDAREVAVRVFTPIGWATLLGVAVFLHVTALTSLFVKWGSLPLAILVCLVASYALTPVLVLAVAFSAAFNSTQAAAIPLCGLFLGLIVILQLLIAKRLEILGGR